MRPQSRSRFKIRVKEELRALGAYKEVLIVTDDPQSGLMAWYIEVVRQATMEKMQLTKVLAGLTMGPPGIQGHEEADGIQTSVVLTADELERFAKGLKELEKACV